MNIREVLASLFMEFLIQEESVSGAHPPANDVKHLNYSRKYPPIRQMVEVGAHIFC